MNLLELETFVHLPVLKLLPGMKMLAMPQIDITKHVWITHYDMEIPVKEMSTLHIQRCIACWNGEGNMVIPDSYLGGREKWLKIFNDELLNRQ